MVNNITICRENFKSNGAFKAAVSRAISVLLENNYIMTVRWDEKGLGILSIDFNYDDQSYGSKYPYWLLPEEIEQVEEFEE